MDIEGIISIVEGVERDLRDRENHIDWTEVAAERAAAEREGREYEAWYCNDCGTSESDFEDMGYQAQRLREVLKALRALKAERESVGAGR